MASSILAALICSCAPRAGIKPTPSPRPIFFSLAPTRSSVVIRHFKYIHSVSAKLDKKEEGRLIEEEMERVKFRLENTFTEQLSSSTLFVSSSLHADVEITLKLEAYGRVPGKWLFYLVGSGVVEAVAQGVVVAKLTHNQWLALGVGAEELASESLTWLGGAFFTNRFLTPIVLSCQVERLPDHKRIWSKHIVTLYSRKLIARLPPDQRTRREEQLSAVSSHAVSELVRSLEKASAKIQRCLLRR